MNTLGQYLIDNGITQAAFAREIDEAPQTVGRYVNGERIPEPEPMKKIYVATKGAVTANHFYELPEKINGKQTRK
jgi:transcriptional regulator with XRE-family HTH domain